MSNPSHMASRRCYLNHRYEASRAAQEWLSRAPMAQRALVTLAAVVEWHIHEISDSIQSVHVFHESSS